MTANNLINKYLTAVKERDALNEEETAGYWLYEASHNPRNEFTKMLKQHDILLSEDPFYAKVEKYLREVGK